MTKRPPLESVISLRSKSLQRRQWAHIYALHGAEAVADLLLARLELGLHPHDSDEVVRVIRAAQCELGREFREFESAIVEAFSTSSISNARRNKEHLAVELAWKERKLAIIRRDEERRRGPIRQSLERVAKQPSAKREPTLAERMARAWKRNQHLLQTA